MVRISGVVLPGPKRIEVALTSIKGIGRSLSLRILEELKIDPNTKAVTTIGNFIGCNGQVIDIALGEESGIELTAQLIDADAERRIVLYTGSNEIELLIKGLDSGARGYALKEGTQSELRTALTTVAEGGTYVDPRLHPALLSRKATQTQRVLSKREREIMDLLAQGLTGEQVAERLFLSPETIKTHIRNAMNKLEANTRVHAIAIALREGFISAPTGS